MYADALDPSCLALIGRALIRRGEVVFLIRTEGGALRLLPCASHDIDGGPDPASWEYRCTVGGPERTLTFDHVPAEGVVHLAYARDPERPWRGYGPLQVAQLAGRLSAETVAAPGGRSERTARIVSVRAGGRRRSDRRRHEGRHPESEGQDVARTRRRLGRWRDRRPGNVGVKALRGEPPGGARHADGTRS